MGNIITNTVSLGTSLDLTDGNTKIKKDLAVVGKSTFTGDSTFSGNLNVTNGKVNDVNIPTLGTDVTTLKTDVSTLKTKMTDVSAGSFTGKAISGATDVTATGTGTFNSVKTNAIDINGDITSTTGGKYILGNGTSGLFLTNGQTTTKAEVLLNKDGSVEIQPATGKIVKVNDIEFSKVQIPNTTTVINNLTTNGLIIAGAVTTTGQITSTGRITAKSGLVVSGDALTVSTGNKIIANGGINAESISVDGVSTLKGATTVTGALTANGVLTVSGDMNTKNIIIGTNKFLIEEVIDTKGTRLCFGKTDGTTKTFFTCMRPDNGNLELF